MAVTNVYQGSYDDLSEITVNAENMRSALNALADIRTDLEPTILRCKFREIRIPDPPLPPPTVEVRTQATMEESATVPLPSTITVRPEYAVVAVGSSVLLYAIDLSTEPTVDFIGWFLNNELVSSEPTFAYDIPTTAEGELLFVARYAEKRPIPTSTVKVIAKAEMLDPTQTLPPTISVDPDVVILTGGSSVYIGTKNSASDSIVAFIGWYLENELVSSEPVFEYTIPKTASGELQFIAKYRIVKQLVKTRGIRLSNLSDHFNFVTYTDDLWVAGTDNKLYSSVNGSEWVVVDDSASFTFATYANGLWVAGGGSNLYTSVDGATWNIVVSSTSFSNFKFATYANGLWVVGSSSGLYTSIDGSEWTLVNDSDYFNFAVYANDLWVAGGRSGLYTSINGGNWELVVEDNDFIDFATYANGIWVAGGYNLYTSIDGVTWNRVIENTSFYFATYANDLWVVGTDSGLYTSIDGVVWGKAISSGYFRFATYANGLWVAGGNNGLYASINGETWNRVISSASFRFATYANGLWVVGGDNGLYTSINGETWNRVIENRSFVFVTYANDLWVAGGYNGLYTSIDGEDWLIAKTPMPGGAVRPEQIYAELEKPIALYAIALSDTEVFDHWENEEGEVLTTSDTYTYTYLPNDNKLERLFTAVFSTTGGQS